MMRTTSILVLALAVTACGKPAPQPPAQQPGPEPCSAAWFEHVEQVVPTGDGAGHGPDIGSDEWRSVIEFKLGIRDDPTVPDPQSQQWCEFIAGLLEERS